ncbi:hypothetical protein [Methylomonas sp. HYX-M1]|uniref:hypothetical protein n=1 Tax=Methylomonas sp. HYX-M1 TaxID=3139307 RepID=UPI00345C5A41
MYKENYLEELTRKIEYNSFMIRCIYVDISVLFAEQGLLYTQNNIYDMNKYTLPRAFNYEYLSLLDRVEFFIDRNLLLKDTVDFVKKMSESEYDDHLFAIYAEAFFSIQPGCIDSKEDSHHFLYFIDLIIQFQTKCADYRVEMMFINNFYYIRITRSNGFCIAYNDFMHEDFAMPIFTKCEYSLYRMHVYDYLLTKSDDYQSKFFNRVQSPHSLDQHEFYVYKEEYELNLLVVDDTHPFQDFSF